MKHPVTLRLDPDLLAKAKSVAGSENRTLTNFIETLIKQRIGGGPGLRSASNATTHEHDRCSTAPGHESKRMAGERDA